MNAVPCVTWVRRGAAKSIPERVKLDENELRRVIEETKDQIELLDEEEEEDEDAAEGQTSAASQNTTQKARKRKVQSDDDDIVNKYGLDDYDEEDDEPDLLKGVGNLTYHASNQDDPYVTLKDDDSDNEDYEIKATDNLIVVGKADKESCTLEVYVYNEDYGNLYVHHDILLSSFPLAVEWLNYDVGEDKPGNFVAVGTMEPVIEIWDVDLVDSLEPVATLGTKRKIKKKKKSSVLGHTDAVLDLSWNSNVRNVLASASADFTVALWDLSEGKVVTSITQHKEKVQCVKWHPYEQQSLISGSFDHTVKVYDCRNPNEDYKSWDLGGEVEKVVWDSYSPLNFFATTDQGHVYYLDSRQDKPVFTLSAHNEAVTGICQSSKVPGMFVTTSSDKTVKIWDVQENKPTLVLERNLKLNRLFCVAACPEAPFVFAFGGEKELKVWDVRESASVRKHFLSRAPKGVTMEGDGDIAEDLAAEGFSGLTIDPEEQEDIDNLFMDETPEQSTSETKKKKKKKKKKKPKPTSD